MGRGQGVCFGWPLLGTVPCPVGCTGFREGERRPSGTWRQPRSEQSLALTLAVGVSMNLGEC